jgi:methylene-tetrahydromethanopterin dehydrogenase
MERKRLLYILSADPQVSPFDINMAYDAGFDAVVPYAAVRDAAVKGLVQDMMFSRGPKGARCTALLVASSDQAEAEAAFRAARESLFDPYRIGLMIDPKGGYTTAAALLAKVAVLLRERGIPGLQGRSVVVLGGTGGVGRAAAAMAALDGARVLLASRTAARAAEAAREARDLHHADVAAVAAPTEADRAALAAKADVVLATGAAGAVMLSAGSVAALTGLKVIADVNAVPPAGVEGIGAKDDGAEVAPGIHALGALAVGDLKFKVEAALLGDLHRSSDPPVIDMAAARARAVGILATL